MCIGALKFPHRYELLSGDVGLRTSAALMGNFPDQFHDSVHLEPFDCFCRAAGIEALGEMMARDAAQACGRAIRVPKHAAGASAAAPKRGVSPHTLLL